MRKQVYHYVLNLRTSVMHVLPSQEQCNMDQANRTKRFRFLADARGMRYDWCYYCYWENRHG